MRRSNWKSVGLAKAIDLNLQRCSLRRPQLRGSQLPAQKLMFAVQGSPNPDSQSHVVHGQLLAFNRRAASHGRCSDCSCMDVSIMAIAATA